MRKSIFQFSKALSSEDVFNSLPKEEQDKVNEFKDYILATASDFRAKEGVREVLRFREVVGKSLFKIDLEDLLYFLKELRNSDFADYSKNKAKDYIKRYLRHNFKDWSERFNEFHEAKTNTDAQNKKQITEENLISAEEVKKLLDAEPSLYLKTFLLTQYEGALRTGETRALTWEMVKFGDSNFTTLNIPSKKNKNATIKIKPVVIKTAGTFLRELKSQQDKLGLNSKYVFPSPQDSNKHISKSVNLWFRELCKKVLGREGNNYLLRHSRGTELQEKVRSGELSKDNAVDFMRHSEKMFDKVYSHMNKEDIITLMKKQIYNDKDLTKEEKSEVKKMREEISNMRNVLPLMLKTITLFNKKNDKKLSPEEMQILADFGTEAHNYITQKEAQ